MRIGNHITDVSFAVWHSVEVALLPCRWRDESSGTEKTRRPRANEIRMTLFEQTWGSTALGFPGYGGQAICDATTIVVEGPAGDVAVYFGGRFAYHIERPSTAFLKDLEMQRLAAVGSERRREYDESDA